jgi:hypothetical protein
MHQFLFAGSGACDPRRFRDRVGTVVRRCTRTVESRRLGFVFISGEEAAKSLKGTGKFFLCEGRFIGEATVVNAE